MVSFADMEQNAFNKMKETGLCYHYKARAECFADVIQAFRILLEDYRGEYKVIFPTIKGSMFGDTDFDFWTCSTIDEIKRVWWKEGINIHRIIKTIQPFD